MPDHVLGDVHVRVVLAVVHLELEAYKARQDCGGPGLCTYRLRLDARRGTDDGESVKCAISMEVSERFLLSFLVAGSTRE